MRRSARWLVPLLMLTLLTGCQNVVYPNQEHAATDEATDPEPTPTILGEYELCAFATAAVREIVKEQFAAADHDDTLTKAAIAAYRKYAARLRELAAKADTAQTRALIIKAAAAAETYARDVEKKGTYKGVDNGPAVLASEDAFPGCDLDNGPA
jgi:hypothetical protein